MRRRWNNPILAIAAITAIAAALRFWGIAFGLPQTFTRPDEETIASVTGRLLRAGPNPEFFRYPTLFMYVMAAIDRVRFGRVNVIDESSVYLSARIVAALLGTASIPLLFIAARRLTTTAAALFAAALCAVAFLHVRDSHFGVTDVPAAFMIVAAFTAIVVGPLERPTKRNVALAGLLCGLAASTKYNAGLILIALVVAAPAVPLAIVGMASAGCGFLAGTPYAIVARRQFAAELTAERSHLAGGHGIAAGIGWIDHATFSLRWGLGVWFLIAAIAGAVMFAARDRRRAVPVLAFPIAYYIVMGSGRSVFVRYMTPLVPFAGLFAGYAIDRLAAFAAARLSLGVGPGSDPMVGDRVVSGQNSHVSRSEVGPRSDPKVVAIAAALLVAVGMDSARRSVALDRLLSQRDSRAIAADIVRDRYPGGASVYQTGAGYGHVMLQPAALYPEWSIEFGPRLVIVQTSRLEAYSGVPKETRDRLVMDYRLIGQVDVEDPASRSAPVFDQQDAFFVPLSGFDRFVRPGPAIEIYERNR